MNRNSVPGRKITVLSCVLLFALFHAITGVFLDGAGFFLSEERFGNDLRWRQNEVCCAHQGVNSFRIWNHERELEGFRPIWRPDKENKGRPGDRSVHAYPPWHTSLFYFYGWMPQSMCLCFMSMVFGLCLCFIVAECIRIFRLRIPDYGIPVAFCLSMIVVYAVRCFIFLNYGVLVLAAILAMNKALERNRDVCAGMLWAVAMIKPQVGLLFFWPLFWKKRYKTICVSITACLSLTFITSGLVKESVMDLILQVPEMAKPYSSTIVVRALKPLFGAYVSTTLRILFFLGVGIITFMVKDRMDFVLLCALVSVIVPIWTYCQCHDYVILLFWYLLWSLMFITNAKCKKALLFCMIGYVMGDVFTCSWCLVQGLDLFDPSDVFGRMYGIARRMMDAFCVTMMVLVVHEIKSSPLPKVSCRLKL